MNITKPSKIIKPSKETSSDDRLAKLQKQFSMHNHAEGITQPVWIGKTSQGASNIIIPTTSGVLGEAVSNGDALYIKSDGKIWKAAASAQAQVDGFVGLSNRNGLTGETADFISYGYKTDYSDLTPGTVYYLSDTAGTLSTSAGTISKKVAVAFSSTTLLIKHF